jgi:hypothetical protein
MAPERETALRLMAMMAVGAMRLSCGIFNREGACRVEGRFVATDKK